MNETRGHLSNNPGLRGHSYDDAETLNKRFLVSLVIVGKVGGLLGMKSFDQKIEALRWINNEAADKAYVVADSWADGKIVWKDYDVKGYDVQN